MIPNTSAYRELAVILSAVAVVLIFAINVVRPMGSRWQISQRQPESGSENQALNSD